MSSTRKPNTRPMNSIINKDKIPENTNTKIFNTWLNSTINYFLTNKCSEQTLKKIKKSLPEIEFLNEEFQDFIQKSDKLDFDQKKSSIVWRKKYPIKNKIELLSYLENNQNGVKNDYELERCYPDIHKDIEILENEKYIKKLKFEKDLEVLFYRDLNDEVEKILVNPENESALGLIRKIWKECKITESTNHAKMDLMKDNMLRKKRGKNRNKSQNIEKIGDNKANIKQSSLVGNKDGVKNNQINFCDIYPNLPLNKK